MKIFLRHNVCARASIVDVWGILSGENVCARVGGTSVENI
jgi:hypothetical protein